MLRWGESNGASLVGIILYGVVMWTLIIVLNL